ncbi:VCBS repeat-containing protein, partial [candidate division WOR-3 bacterium]|nr:VCBS repeat-containing protein [candidate division WOR-3 bacterium]
MRNKRMQVSLLLCAVLLAGQTDGLRLKCMTTLPFGPSSIGTVVCYDSDRDGEGELIFNSGGWGGYDCLNILEYRPYNRYELVQSDTAPLEWPPGVISTGRFFPFDAGDVDRDGKTDLTGQLYYRDSLGTIRKMVCVMESPDSSSYPDSMTWSYSFPPPTSGFHPSVFADLDRDGRLEVFTAYGSTMVFENVADDQESLVYSGLPICTDVNVNSDFDLNGRTDYACNWAGKVRICECIGDNEYAQVCSLEVSLINGNDQFIGRDVDQNGRPEFFVVDGRYSGSGWKLLLYMFEATAEHEYTYWLLDSEQLGMGIEPGAKVSLCADLDGDSVEEIIWSCCTHGYVLKATGPHQFRRECMFMHDHGPAALCNAADFNGNGYKELFVGSCDKISVFEVEPVRIMYPAYRRETLVAGDTCQIRWRIYTPPRCDSVSLFLLTDTVVPN